MRPLVRGDLLAAAEPCCQGKLSGCTCRVVRCGTALLLCGPAAPVQGCEQRGKRMVVHNTEEPLRCSRSSPCCTPGLLEVMVV